MIKFILMDIEGTTTSIDFVHKVLFPYASAHLGNYIQAHQQDKAVQQELDAVIQTVEEEEGQTISREEAVEVLLQWIEEDRKHIALKKLQGYLWKDGYESGQFKGHLYPDVLPCWKKWIAAGKQLGIYSSGSVEAQKLLFGYSEEGDLQPYLSAYFDTRIGHKGETASYQNIQKELGIDPAHILFLSDVPAELDAARTAGFQTLQLLRPGIEAGNNHPCMHDFYEVDKWFN
jgi:enolase-phosphatase E1